MKERERIPLGKQNGLGLKAVDVKCNDVSSILGVQLGKVNNPGSFPEITKQIRFHNKLSES